MCVSGTRGLRAIYMCGTMHSPKCCTNPWLTCSFSRGFPYGQLMRPLTKLITILPYEPNSSSSYKVACNSFFKNHKFIIVKKKKKQIRLMLPVILSMEWFLFFFPFVSNSWLTINTHSQLFGVLGPNYSYFRKALKHYHITILPLPKRNSSFKRVFSIWSCHPIEVAWYAWVRLGQLSKYPPSGFKRGSW